jgi:hypothetical protein
MYLALASNPETELTTLWRFLSAARRRSTSAGSRVTSLPVVWCPVSCLLCCLWSDIHDHVTELTARHSLLPVVVVRRQTHEPNQASPQDLIITIIIIIIIEQHSDKRGSTSDHQYHAAGSREGTERQQLMYRDTTNVEHEMYDSTGKISIKCLEKNLEAVLGSN